MASQEDQLSHKQKLENARSTRGHRRTQSNSQYDFTQLQVTPQLSEEEKKNKEDFKKMISVNHIIDGNSTQQALEAQKYNLNEKKTIVDCIDEDFSSCADGAGNTSSGYSMFNFGKNLHKKRRHNSDFGALTQNASKLFLSNNDQQKLNEKESNQFKRINSYDEDEDEACDDFDSMFQQKFKKFGSQSGAGVYNNGLYSIPELANSSEFGTSVFKDNQSLQSHTKSLVNNTKTLNTIPSNTNGLDIIQEQLYQSKLSSASSQQNQKTNTSNEQLSQLDIQNQQQQNQQYSQNQKILKQQIQEYENAKQNYQNQLKRQFQQQQQNLTNTTIKNDVQGLDGITSTIPKSYIGQISSQLLNLEGKQKDLPKTKVNSSAKSFDREEQNKQNIQLKDIQNKLQNEQNLISLKNSQNNKNLTSVQSNNPQGQQITTSLSQINAPLTKMVSPISQMTSLHSQLSTSSQKNYETLPSSSQINQNTLTNANNLLAAQSSLISSSNISSYHHSRVESASSQFGVQSQINDLKDNLSISRVPKRNSIHEIFNAGGSNQQKPASHVNNQPFQFQCLSKQYHDKSQQSNNQGECESDRISTYSDVNKQIFEEQVKHCNWMNKNSYQTEESSSIQQLASVNNNSQSALAPKVNLMLSKSSMDRKGISKQRYSQCQNEMDEQSSLVEINPSNDENKSSENIYLQNMMTHNQLPSTSFRTNSVSGQKIEEIKVNKENFFQPFNTNSGSIPFQSSLQTQEKKGQLNFSNQLNSQTNNIQKSHRGPVGDNQQLPHALPTHQSSQSFSLPKSNINISGNSNSSTLKSSVQNQQYLNQLQQQTIIKNNQNQQQNHKSNFSTSNVIQNNNKHQNQQNDMNQRNISMNINISNVLNQNNSLNSNNIQSSNNFQNSNTSSNSKSHQNIMNQSNIQNNSNQQLAQSTIQQNLYQKQQTLFQDQLDCYKQQKQESSTLESEQQIKTYSQMIKQFLQKSNNNQSRLSSNNTLPNNESMSKDSSNQNTLKKSSNSQNKEIKQKNSGSISTNPLSSNANQINSLEGRVFMLESKILSLRQKTDNLEQQNLNLTQELIHKNNEKDHFIKENIESKKRIVELENITKRNEESIQIIFQMLQKSQSDYELLRSQKQEVSTNIFTDISCMDSPHEIYNNKGQKQKFLKQQEFNQTESGDKRFGGNQSYLFKDKEQKLKPSFNNIDNYSNFQKANYGQQVQQQSHYNGNQNQQYNENSSFNSLLQEKKQQQNMQTKQHQNQQYQFNGQTYSNSNNILKPSNLNLQNQARFSVYN